MREPQVLGHLRSMVAAMLDIERELLVNISSIRDCFGRRVTRRVRRLARFVSKTASEIDTNYTRHFVGGSDHITQNDTLVFNEIAPKLHKRFKRTMVKLVKVLKSFVKRLASITGDDIGEIGIREHLNEQQVYPVLDHYINAEPTCEKALYVVINWYPQFWFPQSPEKWSIFHRLYYHISGLWYVNAAVNYDVWWFWLVNPTGWPTYGLGLQ